MIVYDTEKNDVQYVNFYDVENKTTIVRVRNQSKLLFVHPIVQDTATAEMGTVLLTGRMLDLGSNNGDDTDADVSSDLCIFNT